jgi:hypothetical protein
VKSLSVSKSFSKALYDTSKKRAQPAKVVRRARIILSLAKGSSARYIATLIDCVPTTIGNWKKRWTADTPPDKRDLMGWLQDGLRIGAPCHFTLDRRAQIIALACENTEEHGSPRPPRLPLNLGPWPSPKPSFRKSHAISAEFYSRLILNPIVHATGSIPNVIP